MHGRFVGGGGDDLTESEMDEVDGGEGEDEITDLTAEGDLERTAKRMQQELAVFEQALKLRMAGRKDFGQKTGGATSGFNTSLR